MMPLTAPPALSVAHRAPQRTLQLIEGGRGRPPAVKQSRADALAPVLEAIAICDDAVTTASRIHDAVLALDIPSALALHLAAGLAQRAGRSREEMRRLAGLLDGDPAA